MSQQSDAALAAFNAFSTQFGSFQADAVKALQDIAAKPGQDPADAAALTTIATGLGSITSSLATLDAQIKAADPGAAAGGNSVP